MTSPLVHTQGPVIIGCILDLFLLGAYACQTIVYFKTYGHVDSRKLQLFVALVFFVDILSTGLLVIYTYDRLILHFGNLVISLSNLHAPLAKVVLQVASNETTWVSPIGEVFSAVTTGLVQLFLARRVRMFMRRDWVFVIICILAVLKFLSDMSCGFATFVVKDFTNFGKIRIVGIFMLTCSAACDVIITTALIHQLKKYKTGIKLTDATLDRIIIVTFQTGLITAIWAVAGIITSLAVNDASTSISNLPLKGLYTNSLMVNLNFRKIWADSMFERNGASDFNLGKLRESLRNISFRKGTPQTLEAVISR